MTDSDLIPIEDARQRLPPLPDGSRATARWVSEEARRLGCYRKIGKGAFIIGAAWEYFIQGRPWPYASVGGKARATTIIGIASANFSALTKLVCFCSVVH